MFKFLNPKTAISNLNTLIKDASNLIFYRAQISKMEDQGLLTQFKLRSDILKRVYYVINLEPETLFANDSVDLEKSRVFESVNKIQGIFADNNLVEIIEVSSKRIKTEDYYAYLVWIKFKGLSKWANWKQLIGFTVSYLGFLKLGIIAYQNHIFIIDAISRLFGK